MAIIFNELSATPIDNNKEAANLILENLIKTFVAAKKFGYTKIRFSKQLHEIELADQYSMINWLNETNQKNLKDILLEARDYPEYDTNDLWFGEKYILSTFFFEDNENGYPKTKCYGLASSYLYNTLSISLASNSAWKKNEIIITETNETNNEEKPIEVKNIFSTSFLVENNVTKYISDTRPLTLSESGIDPAKKKIHLSDHHGKKELGQFSKKLVTNKYIVEIKSTDWGGKEFIRKVHENGAIEIVLYWSQREYALLIQTTGKTLRETEEIAKQLKAEFDN